MKIPWKAVAHVGIGILNTIVPGVSTIEQIALTIPALRGAAKQDAVVELVKNALQSSEFIAGKDLANDADVEKATRGVIDAVVALHSIVAQKHAAVAG